MSKFNKVVWGIVLIVLGVIFGLNALEITNVDFFFDGWWTLFIIVPCFVNLFNEKEKTGNIIGLLIGFFLLLACNDIISFGLIFKLIIPVTLVMIGLSLIFKDGKEKKVREKIKKVKVSGNDNEHYAVFGGLDLSFSDDKFKGCYLNAIFGGIKCDLRDTDINEDLVINVCSIFGGVDILMPDNVNVQVVSTPIFGCVSDERRKKKSDSKNTIFVNATCMFGGVDIK